MSPPRHSTEGIDNVGEIQGDLKSDSLLNETRAAANLGFEEGNGDTQRDGSRQNSDSMTSRAEESKLQVANAGSGNMAKEGNLIDIAELSEGNNDGTKHELTVMPSSTEDTSNIPDEMSSSTATLRPEPISKNKEATAALLPPSAQVYLDPTPKTPGSSRSTSSGVSMPQYGQSLEPPERSPTRSDAGFDERPSASEDEREADSRSEIQSIMDQFSEEGGGPGVEEVMSPRLEFAGPLLGNPIQHPPRKSSLEPMNPALAKAVQSVEDLRLASISPPNYQSQDDNEKGPAVPPKPGSIHSFSPSRAADERLSTMDMPMSPTGSTLHRPPPPDPEPEPDLPFDFHRFLEQLRHRTADPVAKFLRSFLLEFGKKQWMVHEQVKIIGDFLVFITNKMAQCEVWRDVSDAEFDNAREGMEKLVMNRLYTQTFSPAIPPPQPIPGGKSKRKSLERPLGPGRRGQHQEDVERDDILAQKVSIYGWVKEEHLDIAPVGESGRRFLVLAQQELLKIKTYRAPRDKIICVLNCCKVIFGLLKHSKSDSSADSFMPLLIYVVLQANPEHLVSNVQYILRFRNQDKLVGEAGYYLSSLMGAVQFIENLDRTSLSISDEEFEVNVEAAVSAIAEKHQANEAPPPSLPPQVQLSEKSALNRPELAQRRSGDGESSTPRRLTSSYETDSGDGADEKAAMSGLLRTIQRPLTSIGRIFSEETTAAQNGPARTPLPGNTPRMSPVPATDMDRARSPLSAPAGVGEERNRSRLNAEDAAARQASAETAEARRLQRAEHANVVETLAGMFPDLDREIISDVVTQKNGRVALAVDACLALSS